MRCVEEIQAWQKARELVRQIYKTSQDGRLKRDLGFRDQLCRASVSSMSNIAEGFGRKNDREFARFLDIAKGSTTEVQSLLYVAFDVGYLTRDEFDRLYKLAAEVASLISGLTSYLRRGQKRESGVQSPKTQSEAQGPKSGAKTG
jgi:four helix bundle protein